MTFISDPTWDRSSSFLIIIIGGSPIFISPSSGTQYPIILAHNQVTVVIMSNHESLLTTQRTVVAQRTFAHYCGVPPPRSSVSLAHSYKHSNTARGERSTSLAAQFSSAAAGANMGGCCGKGTAPNDADKTPYSQAKKPTSKAEPAPGKEPVSPPTVTKPADEATTEGPPTDQVQAAKQVSAVGPRKDTNVNE